MYLFFQNTFAKHDGTGIWTVLQYLEKSFGQQQNVFFRAETPRTHDQFLPAVCMMAIPAGGAQLRREAVPD